MNAGRATVDHPWDTVAGGRLHHVPRALHMNSPVRGSPVVCCTEQAGDVVYHVHTRGGTLHVPRHHQVTDGDLDSRIYQRPSIGSGPHQRPNSIAPGQERSCEVAACETGGPGNQDESPVRHPGRWTGPQHPLSPPWALRACGRSYRWIRGQARPSPRSLADPEPKPFRTAGCQFGARCSLNARLEHRPIGHAIGSRGLRRRASCEGRAQQIRR